MSCLLQSDLLLKRILHEFLVYKLLSLAVGVALPDIVLVKRVLFVRVLVDTLESYVVHSKFLVECLRLGLLGSQEVLLGLLQVELPSSFPLVVGVLERVSSELIQDRSPIAEWLSRRRTGTIIKDLLC